MATKRWPATKDPDEVKDFGLDWTDRLTEGGDELASSEWSILSTVTVPPLVIQDGTQFTSQIATVWLTGGLAETDYELLNRVTTLGGRTYDQTVLLRVRAL